MNDWYEEVDAYTELTQGDIILNCPVVRWGSKPIQLFSDQDFDSLKSAIEIITVDVIVLTQACDLEQKKVKDVILCPHETLDDYKRGWEDAMKNLQQNPTPKAWIRACEDIKNGYNWNLAMLNECNLSNLTSKHRIVDFHEIFTLPRSFLESLILNRGESRLRLRPPYREHLSQAFARFFMRVGLPTGIKKVW